MNNKEDINEYERRWNSRDRQQIWSGDVVTQTGTLSGLERFT